MLFYIHIQKKSNSQIYYTYEARKMITKLCHMYRKRHTENPEKLYTNSYFDTSEKELRLEVVIAGIIFKMIYLAKRVEILTF